MIGMCIVAVGLALVAGGMLYYDSLEKKRKEKYRPAIPVRVEEKVEASEFTAGIEQELQLLREELKGFERRLYLKLALICVVAIVLFGLVARYCR